jgi:Kdo2-lipid IVA lauroyltransferase/acyltransferase
MKPSYILTKLGLKILFLISLIPLKLQYPIGRFFGSFLFIILKSRRNIVKKNIKLCFPELSLKEHNKLCKEVFHENTIGFLEAAYTWWQKPDSIFKNTDYHGIELIEEALKKGKGVLLIGAHFSNLELAALLIGHKISLNVTYRMQNNPIVNAIITKKRKRYFNKTIDRKDTRSFLKSLKNNEVVWYAPDQDYGMAHSIFAPFFGIDAATISATSKLLQFNNSEALFLTHQRNEFNRYQITISKFKDNLPSGSIETDAKIINQKIEKEIRKYPAQYMWTHRRFKSRPNNEPSIY